MSLEGARGPAARGGASRRRKYKFVLLGEGRVGKTSILLRFCRNEFDGRQPPTLNASYMDRRVTVDGRPVQLSIWDTAGQERFHALGPIYYRDADAALLVYDITDVESFAKVKSWVRELRKVVGDGIAIAIAGNKLDLARDRSVDGAEATQYAASVGAKHFYVSAKLNKGLEECFVDLTRKILAQTDQANGAAGADAGAQNGAHHAMAADASAGRGKIVLVADDDEGQGTDPTSSTSSSCC